MNQIREIRINIFNENNSPEPISKGSKLLEFNILTEPVQHYVYRTILPPDDFQSIFDRTMDEIKNRVEQAFKDANIK